MKPDSQKINNALNRGVEKIINKKHLKNALFLDKKLRIKHGIDPTGDKIHLGRATQLWKLKELQDLGHKIILIFGDFTAQVGDPSDKPEGRKGLTEKEINRNMQAYLEQFSRVLDIKKAEIYHNSEWFSKMPLKEFLSLASTFSVQQLVQRRNFKERWEEKKPISLKEITYPLLQGYDSVMVKADVELGGYDQLFNLNTGRDIQRLFNQKPQDIITLKMLFGLDGRKMSTSWGNVINIIDPPGEMYGKLMSMKDEMIVHYLELCTLLSEKDIAVIKKELKGGEVNPRDIKARLALEIVALYYCRIVAEKAKKEFEKVFEQRKSPSQIKTFLTPKSSYTLAELLIYLDLAKSKNDAKRLIEQGGVKINFKVIKNFRVNMKIKEGMIIQVGKRKFVKITKRNKRKE